MRRSIRFLFSGLIVSGSAFACGSPPTGLTTETAQIAGNVFRTSRSPSGEGVDVTVSPILKPAGENLGSDMLILRVRRGVPIYLHDAADHLTSGSIDDLVAGTTILAIHTGVVVRSLPPQFEATRVDLTAR